MPTIKPNKSQEVIGKIFKDQGLQYGLKEFGGFDISEILYITEQESHRYYVRDLKSNEQKFVYDEQKNNRKPEEIIRQLWLHKLNKIYGYPFERMETEKSVHFGREVHAKRADIVILKEDKITPYIIFEIKEPNAKKAEEQLKTYMSGEWAEGGVWSNGVQKFILYRPFPKEYVTTFPDIPRVDQAWDDLFEEKLFYKTLDKNFDLAFIINRLEELVLAASGESVFDEVFKLLYAKLYDEDQAKNYRQDGEVIFKQYKDPKKTYQVINDNLFNSAIAKWPNIFNSTDKIELSPDQLQVCIPLLQTIKLFGTGREELEIVDRAFEHLITEVSKGQKGQYFTPRNAIRMCVKILNPRKEEYIIDPACGSGGFLLHTMYWVWDKYLENASQEAKKEYASKYLFGVDFDDKMRKISQALMLIAGDGKHHIFKRNSLDARDWTGDAAEFARVELKELLYNFSNSAEDEENRKTFRHLNFDILLTNPPFAGEITDGGLLRQYDFAKKDSKIRPKMERHILFIERDIDALRPGGRVAIVLPQGVLNNTNMEYVRRYLFDKARILAVVGLHGNTFKLPAPAKGTGTKTSVLFLQKWLENEKLPKDYPIFMAVSKKSGKDNSGEYVFKKDVNGNYIHDARGKKVLDDDLDEIAEEFIKFAKDQKFNF
ncbi:MAG: Type I Restriction Enzyme [Candidatus Falkowbacteria bacterium GW2011_GWA2_39_24]|uniref:Type I Restriction Enzyme n=1 Tax=Candidatus Falkowbacteria bacterium GW2011_GWA2_39_24 TaxID=1618634 RepID=A0A0G0NC76_9BACT|nr:MAG: Type I Restriction Enzyme [Candidatus Falkowbacteria bacterium GW2011_GWA2_39_24]